MLRLLPEELVAAMAEPLRAFLPQQHPFLHGFFRMDRAGEVIYGHHGDLEDSHSVFALLPKAGLGVFAVYNGSGGPAANMLLDAIVDRLQGRTLPPAIEPPADFAGRADRYAGEYASSRRNFSTLEKAALLGGALTISASADGYLVTQGVRLDRLATGWKPPRTDSALATATRKSASRKPTPAISASGRAAGRDRSTNVLASGPHRARI